MEEQLLDAYNRGLEAGKEHAIPSPMTVTMFKGVDEKLDTIIDHLATLNGKVAKHSEWINRYDIRIAEEIPDMQTTMEDHSRKIYAGVVLLAALQIAISFYR